MRALSDVLHMDQIETAFLDLVFLCLCSILSFAACRFVHECLQTHAYEKMPVDCLTVNAYQVIPDA